MARARWLVFCSLLVGGALVLPSAVASNQASGPKKKQPPTEEPRMSPGGQAAAIVRALVEGQPVPDRCVNQAECEDGFLDELPVPRGQAETSIAVDSTGQHVVVGFNDGRGFSSNPISVSGFMYSDDGGTTFVDGGQLPSPGTDIIGTTRFPQIFGDPDVKYLGGCTFVYASILVKKFSATPPPGRTVQTLGVHRSTDCGHTWDGPFEVTSATNPNGQLTAAGSPRDAADKEFLDVDPETGRVVITWSNFTPFAPGGVEIASTYSDGVATGSPPTWSTRQVVAATTADGQSSIPRFAAHSANAYVAWRRFPAFFGNAVGFARSTDNGATWQPAVDITPTFFTMDQVLGNDRVNTSPSLAVDTSGGTFDGAVYVVYADNDAGDGADIMFQKSGDQGVTFSAPLVLNSRPGNDRAQWFPWVTVDRDSGRIFVFYYDQGIAQTGDRTEVSYTFSDNGGTDWSPPVPLTDRPFKAGWGNDTGQPNLGDYNQAVAQSDDLFVSWASSVRPPLGFADGQPDGNMTVPDVLARRIPKSKHKTKVATVNLGAVSSVDSGGNGYIDPGEEVKLTLPLRNYVTNPLNARRLNGLQGALSTTTPGVVITNSKSPYSKLDPGETGSNTKDFVLKVAPTFAPGTDIELRLDVSGPTFGAMTLPHTLFTGTPVPTVLLSEDFNGTPPGTLPLGWTTAHAGGANTVPWTTSSTFCATSSNAAFHQNANDGPPSGSPTRFERLFSPPFIVPLTSQYVTIDFDVCYDTEEDPNFNILAYDGFLLRVTDLTLGRILRSVLAEAFEDEFTTGAIEHYPRHFPRSRNPAYFEDMSAWAGSSGSFLHVRMRLPGMAGSTAQLRFEYTQDGSGTCQDVGRPGPCGVMLDNLVIRSVQSAP